VANNSSVINRVKRAGCWAVGVYIFGIFFALGTLASLFNGDLLSTFWGLLLTGLALGLGIWLARRGTGRF
jgi:hypothetical protein